MFDAQLRFLSRFSRKIFLAVACGMLLVACGHEQTPESGVDVSTARTYEVRGLVRQLPTGLGTELMIHHEAIPDLVDDRGEVVGMEAMTMSFPISDAALLDDVAVGDRIAFTLNLDWEDSPALEITRIAVLPADVRLRFESGSAEELESGSAVDNDTDP